jgi:hypothetical protein
VSDKTLKKMQAAYDRVRDEAVAGVYGQRYIPKDDPDNADNKPDFPYIEDPEGYVTHVPLEQDKLKEAEDDTPQKPIDAGEEAGEDIAASPDAGMGADDGGIGDTGMDTAGNMPGVEGGGEMPGMGEQEEEKLSANQLGRVYELKKIYSRLASVESFLTRTTDDNMLELRKLVSQSINLFELVISNYKQYKENVDEIIVTYYEFLDTLYESVKEYFHKQSKE